MDKLTMFADYRVPQMLAHLGAIEYSPALLSLLRRGTSSHTTDTGLLSTGYFSCLYLYWLHLSSPQFNLHLLSKLHQGLEWKWKFEAVQFTHSH